MDINLLFEFMPFWLHTDDLILSHFKRIYDDIDTDLSYDLNKCI